jgi:hypothetical protein
MMIAQSPAKQPSAGVISGHVVDAVGAVIPKASVFVRRSSPPEEIVRLATHTDANGDFTLVLPDGGYDLLVTSPGFVAAVQTVPVFHGKKRRTQWKLKIVPCDFPGTVCDTFQ